MSAGPQSVADASARHDLSMRIHALLRHTTGDVHQRLHRHDGFASIQDGSCTLDAYRRLLLRLHGFHRPFEAAADLEPERSAWLADDLAVLGIDAQALEAAASCRDLPRLHDDPRRVGALYVVEGSALGGRDLFRGLDHLFGERTVAGRRFFHGRGAATIDRWKDYLARLAQCASDPTRTRAIIDAAVETFACFEHWMADWNEAPHDSR
jgi:heme oxygenase